MAARQRLIVNELIRTEKVRYHQVENSACSKMLQIKFRKCYLKIEHSAIFFAKQANTVIFDSAKLLIAFITRQCAESWQSVAI